MKPFDFKSTNRQALGERLGNMDQLAGMRMLEAIDGLARGSRMLEVWTGTGLTFTILPDRAMDISACRYNGLPLSWMSPNGDTDPHFFDPHGLGWLRTFSGGLLATCGLDQFGPPNVDEGEAFGQHGRVGTIPARYVSYRAEWQGDQYTLTASGEVRQARLFGENLVLRRSISTRMGSNVIHIDDTVTNEGHERQPHMILYHFNLGYPLLGEQSELRVDAERSMARDADADPGLGDWMHFQSPTPGYREQVFRHILKAGADGKAAVELRNPKLGLGLRWSYSLDVLPNLYEWKMMGQGAYVLGVEPSNTNVLGGRASAREAGELPFLEQGESRHYHIDVEVFEMES